jgi:hypothetical protein
VIKRLRYKCHTCDEWHDGLPSPGWPYPIAYLTVPESERQQRVTLTSDTCVIDEAEFYVRASLPIHVHGSGDPLTWGVWVSLSDASFARFRTLREDVGREPGESFFGWLCSAIPGYPDTELLKTRVHVQPWPDRPVVELEPTDHPLAVDYREGMTLERAIALVQPFLERMDRG